MCQQHMTIYGTRRIQRHGCTLVCLTQEHLQYTEMEKNVLAVSWNLHENLNFLSCHRRPSWKQLFYWRSITDKMANSNHAPVTAAKVEIKIVLQWGSTPMKIAFVILVRPHFLWESPWQIAIGKMFPKHQLPEKCNFYGGLSVNDGEKSFHGSFCYFYDGFRHGKSWLCGGGIIFIWKLGFDGYCPNRTKRINTSC